MKLNLFQWQAGVAAAAALLAITVAQDASAQSYTPQQEQLCTGDALRLCSSEIPSVERITACMHQRRHLLSPGCRAVFRASPRPARPQVAAPVQPSGPVRVARPARAGQPVRIVRPVRTGQAKAGRAMKPRPPVARAAKARKPAMQPKT